MASEDTVAAELDELQRRYRIMEGDRKSYAEEVQAVVRKQKAQIEKLKRENGQLKGELSLQTSSKNGDLEISREALRSSNIAISLETSSKNWMREELL